MTTGSRIHYQEDLRL